ncbi:MAG: hypothetical protein JJE25_11985, partial [Bacteroidia bacterium]|nr:hypothetical protein [Bacteroidia bacterium]
ARLVKWLKRSEKIRAVLICQRDGLSSKFLNESFDEVIVFRNEYHLFRILKNFKDKNVFVHAFGPKTFYADKARVFLKKKMIYDMQDVLCIYYGLNTDISWFRKEFPHEKNLLSLSDGLVSHGMEPIAATKIYGIGKRPPTLYFPLCCDNDFFCNNSKLFSHDDIHLVYAGEIMGAFRDSRQFGNVQFHWLIEELSKQRLHFHVYPSPASPPSIYEEYEAVARQNPFFHLHKPVAQSELAKEMSAYHFGIIPFFKTNTGQSDEKYKYSTALKLFNFMEAGIPVLISNDIEFQKWLALRYGSGLGIARNDISRLRIILEGVDYNKMVSNLLKGRKIISLSRNIGKLIGFYNKIGGRQ